MKVSNLLVACLEQEGVRCVFGVPGEEVEDLLFSMDQVSVRASLPSFSTTRLRIDQLETASVERSVDPYHASCVIEVPVDASVNTALVDKLAQHWGHAS